MTQGASVLPSPYSSRKEFLRTVNTSHWDGDSARKPRHPSKDAEADNPKFDCEVPIFRVSSSRGTTIFQLNLRPKLGAATPIRIRRHQRRPIHRISASRLQQSRGLS